MGLLDLMQPNPYNTKLWRSRRADQLQREPLCRFCRQMGRLTPATVADHIIPHRGDLALFWGELQSLCAPCHSGPKQAMEKSGRIRGCDVNGNPIGRPDW